MASVETRGTSPKQYGQEQIGGLLKIINLQGAKINRQATKTSPVGVGGLLRGSWVFSPARPSNPVAVVANSREYFLPVEVGRKPGKGVSRKGQAAIALWAQRVLGVSAKEGKSIAYLLSRKYKSQGRPAQGFLGLAKRGSIPSGDLPPTVEPVRGSLLDRNFKELGRRLETFS